MRFFDGLKFVVWDHVPRCSAFIDKKLPFPALNYAHAGRIVWGKTILNAPVAWWTWPEEEFCYGSLPNETWDHDYVVFDGPRVERFYREGLIPRHPKSAFAFIRDNDDYVARWTQLFHLLVASRSEEAVHVLEGLLLTVHRSPDPAPQSPVIRKVAELATNIRADPIRAWDFAAEGKKAGVSSPHLRRVFKAMYGLPLHAFLLKTRIAFAARLLRTTADPIKVIADQAGFADLFYFSKQFKRHHAVSPSAYRNEVLRFSANRNRRSDDLLNS